MEVVRFPTLPHEGRAAQIGRDGLWRLSSRILHRLAAPVVDWGAITFFERTLDAELPLTLQSAATVREVTVAEIGAVEAGIDPDQSREEIARRFRRGDRAFAAIDADGTGVHTRWVTTSRTYIPEIDREIVPGPGQAYFYNGYTRPEYRGRGIDGSIRTAIFTTLRLEGFRAVYSYVRLDNPAGLRAAMRWQRPVGTVRYLRIGRGESFLFGVRQTTFPALVRTNHVV